MEGDTGKAHGSINSNAGLGGRQRDFWQASIKISVLNQCPWLAQACCRDISFQILTVAHFGAAWDRVCGQVRRCRQFANILAQGRCFSEVIVMVLWWHACLLAPAKHQSMIIEHLMLPKILAGVCLECGSLCCVLFCSGGGGKYT